MNDNALQDSPRWKILRSFFVGSVLSGLLFAWCVTRPSLQEYWFRTEEIWTFPTEKFWLLASGLFFLNLAGSTYIAVFKKWLRSSTYRLIIGGMFFAVVPVTIWLIERLSALLQLFLTRLAQALVLSLMLLIITQKWYWRLAMLMLLVSLATPVIAGIPYAFLKTISLEWFEVSKFFVNSLLLALLFGYWLAKSNSPPV